MPALSWRHHTLIQALLSRGPLKEKEFHSIFAGVTGKNPGVHQPLFNEYLRTINMELSYVQFELRACRNQYDGNIYYGVINNIADEQSKLGTKYTVPQIAFYKSIIEAIVQDATAQGCISNIDALNVQLESQITTTGAGYSSQGSSSQVPAAFRNFSMSQKEKTIEEFVQDKWLCAMTDGRIGLGVRSFLDLRSWFHNNEVPLCDVCNEAGVKAELCPNQSCTVRIHEYCLKRKFSQRRVEKVCPGCGEQWPYTVAKAEAVEEEFADVNVVSSQDQPPSSQQSMRKRLRSSRNVEEDQGGPSQSQPPPQPSSRKKRGSSKIVEEDDQDGPSQSQLPPLPSARKKVRTSEIVHAETIASHPKQEPSETRRVTRNSARLRSGN